MAVSLLTAAMDNFGSGQFWLFCVLGALVAFHFFFLGPKKANLPPSPGALPIVGSFPFLGARPNEPAHLMFSRLAQKFGPIFYVRLGSIPTIVISNSDTAKEVLRDQDHIFASRPNLSVGKYLGMNYRTMGFAPSGEYFKRLRKIYSQELFAPKLVQGTHAIREEGVFSALGGIYQRLKEGEEVINLTAVIAALSLNSILSMLFRWKAGESNKEDKSIGRVKLSEVRALIKEISKLAGEFNAGDYITIARWLDIQGVIGRLKKINKRMTEQAAALIEEYERDGKRSANEPDANIFDVLLSLEGEDRLNALDLSGVTFDLINAGSETTGNSTDWTIAELLRQPELHNRLRAELESVIGKDRFVNEADIPNLPFLQAVVTESLRLHPPGPLGIPHYSMTATKVAGYDIPAGTTTVISIFSINRDPKYWPEPLRFNPDRFFRQEKDISPFGTVYHLLPFSSGRRRCPGILMGFTIVQLMVANFIHSFDYQPAGGLSTDTIDVINEAPAIVSQRAQDLLVTVTPRLNSAVYEKFLHEWCGV